MPPQKDREAWEYVGDQLDRLSKRSGWTAPQVWIPIVIQAVVGLMMLAGMYAVQQEHTRRLDQHDASLLRLDSKIDLHRENWRAHRVTPGGDN